MHENIDYDALENGIEGGCFAGAALAVLQKDHLLRIRIFKSILDIYG
jgi:hypothetical protein